MTDRLIGPRTKTERAKKHFHDVAAEIESFVETNPYYIVTEKDPETGHNVTRALLDKTPAAPPILSCMIGDVIHNLRSSLDLLYWQLVDIGPGSPPNKGDVFPIYNARDGFESAGREKLVKRVGKDAMKVLHAVKPYKGGNDALWLINELDNVDKHRLLVTLAHHLHTVILEATGEPGNPAATLSVEIKPERRIEPLEHGNPIVSLTELTSGSSGDMGDSKLTTNRKYVFTVALYEPGVIEPESVVPLLQNLGSAAEGVIEAFSPLLESHQGSAP